MHREFFRFKKFVVYHNLSAMKVGTDGVLLGSWVNIENEGYILDIGTGSGLIALMLAQRSNALIHAIDIDKDACLQADLNFKHSPWKDRLSVYNQSLQNFSSPINKTYQTIVCNPPFFVNSLKNPDIKRCMARHTDSLPYSELFNHVKRLLCPVNGKFFMIMPYLQLDEISTIAQSYGFSLFKKMLVKGTPDKDFHRVLSGFWLGKKNENTDSLCIEINGRHQYSEEYKNLTKDFYLRH